MIPDIDDLLREVTFKASRSGGAGGQHVNKVSTKVQLDFDIQNSGVLTEAQKQRILEKLASRITGDGILQITSQAERSQLGNKRVVIDRFRELITDSFKVKKKRKATRVPKAVKEKRLREKKMRGEIKKRRRGDLE